MYMCVVCSLRRPQRPRESSISVGETGRVVGLNWLDECAAERARAPRGCQTRMRAKSPQANKSDGSDGRARRVDASASCSSA